MEIRKEESEEEKEEIDEEKEEESNEENEEESNNNKNNNEKNEDMQKNEIETNINTEKEIEQEQKNPDDLDLEATSTYILKYTRKGDELKEIAEETGLRKSENCLFMLNIKLIKSDSVFTENGTPLETSENFLVFCCHAIYFDEIYERVYTLDDLAKENKYFKVFESTEEAKNVIDETIRKNEKNDKKIFLAFKDKELKLHMKLSFFDKEKEIVLNIPKKKLNDEDKINLLPEFLKEIQDKMNHLSEENKKMKIKKTKVYNNRIKEIKNNYRANNTFNFDISNNKNDIKDDAKEKKLDKTTINNSNILNEISKDNISDINASTNLNNTTKKIRKKVKVVKKKQTKLEENFF